MWLSHSRQLVCLLAFFGLSSGFPGTHESHGRQLSHDALHKRCPFAAKEEVIGEEKDKRFLFDTMSSPVDSRFDKLLTSHCISY